MIDNIMLLFSGLILVGIAGGQTSSTRVTRPQTEPCSYGQFTCNSGRRCLNQSQVCDQVADCNDRSDETACRNRSTECWSWQSSCSNETKTCIDGYYQCGNGLCIEFDKACNRKDDCGDRSDEQRSVPGFKCTYGSFTDKCVLPQRYVNTSRAYCSDKSDTCYDDSGVFTCFTCFNNRHIISNKQICDGVFDCSDLSDECLCETTSASSICDNICKHERSCQIGTFTCANETLPVSSVCNRRRECSNGVDELYCRKNASSNLITCPGNIKNGSVLTAFVCDGRPECFDFSDECGAGCETEQPFCGLVSRFDAPDNLQIMCEANGGGLIGLNRNDICDGLWSPCVDRIVEEETNCTARFYCRSGNFISIDVSLVCDGNNDCDDGRDERRCSERFYCTNGTTPISVQRNFMFDDIWDCSDGSDECPTDFLAGNAFSSRNEMISELFLKVWLWIMAVAAIAGNLYVIIKTIRDFKNIKDMSNVGKSNHFLIFNLALADSLMGIYLAILAGYSIWFSGRYCFKDESWRTGTICQFIGALSVVSSEASILILSVLTSVRLFTVTNPIRSRSLKLPAIAAGVLVAWGIAVLLAVLPISTFLSDEVTDGAWLPSKFFNTTTVGRKKATRFSNDIAVFSPSASPLTNNPDQLLTWVNIGDYLATHSSGQVIQGLYGFYSRNSVCVSKLFVTNKQPGWQFSIAIVSINFAMFVFVACAYLAIYKISTGGRLASSNTERSAQMQRKIIKLVVSNFACWVPICILAFINFSEVVHLQEIAYVVTAVVLLPINSVLNPLLYSNAFERLWKKSQPIIRRARRLLSCCCRHDKATSENLSMTKPTQKTGSGMDNATASRVTQVTPLQTPDLARKRP